MESEPLIGGGGGGGGSVGSDGVGGSLGTVFFLAVSRNIEVFRQRLHWKVLLWLEISTMYWRSSFMWYCSACSSSCRSTP